MHVQQRLYLALNIIGGPAVLGSYAHGISTHPGEAELLWGDVPQAAIPLYTANMPLAAVGYLLWFWLLVRVVDPEELCVFGRYGFGFFNLCTAVILLCSTAWMPLCFYALDHQQAAILPLIQVVLAATGIGSVALAGGLWSLRSQYDGKLLRAALVGAGFFCLQTAILDGLIWPRYFHL